MSTALLVAISGWVLGFSGLLLMELTHDRKDRRLFLLGKSAMWVGLVVIFTSWGWV